MLVTRQSPGHIDPGGQVSQSLRCNELLLDGTTPVAAYRALHGLLPGPSLLFESAPGAGQLARHSVIGLGAVGELRASQARVEMQTPRGRSLWLPGQVQSAVRTLLDQCKGEFAHEQATPFIGAYGLAAFEFAGMLERLPQLGDTADTDDLHLVVPSLIVVFDHATHRVRVVAARAMTAQAQQVFDRLNASTLAAPGMPPPVSVRRVLGRRTFTAMVDAAVAAIHSGDAFQVVLSQTWEALVAGDAFDVYRRLRSLNPSPYMFYIELDAGAVLGASPEMLCKLDGRQARLRPLAGTRARPARPADEQRVARELRGDPKERAEHVMLVDLGRNDLGRVCDYGSVKVVELFNIERYSHVMHLVSEIRGRLRRACDAVDLLAAAFPAGTVSGAPKIRAMELIAQLEQRRRGYYGGSVVRLGFDGSLDACIVLRSARIVDGVASFSAGAGIVADSVAALEDAECCAKAMAVARALGAQTVPA